MAFPTNSLKAICWLLLASLASLFGHSSTSLAQSTPLARVIQFQDGQGYSVRTGQGTLLRGIAVAVYKYQRVTGNAGHLRDPLFWNNLQAQGLNSVRLVAFDPWQRSHGDAGTSVPYTFADFSDSVDLAATLSEIDVVVNMAVARNMYVMINYHDTGNYRDPDHSRATDSEGRFPTLGTLTNLRKFWRAVATRYANNPNVFFELTNEPVAWFSFDYSDRDLANFKSIYDDVRARAPSTHVVLCSFANTAAFGKQSVLDVARKLKTLGIPFTNESVGFHPYNVNYPRRNVRTELDLLRKEFPVINTEQNFPIGLVAGSDDPDASGYDGDRFGVQSMERMGISWFHWNSSDPKELKDNFIKRVIFDAKRKGYFWVP